MGRDFIIICHSVYHTAFIIGLLCGATNGIIRFKVILGGIYIKKIRLFDRALVKEFLVFLASVEFILALILIFLDIPQNLRLLLGTILAIILVVIYVILWKRAIALKAIQLNINNTKINIEEGDLFTYKGLKVIAFNEYFDTIVDEDIISSKSLNGIFVKDKVQDVSKLDNDMANDSVLQSKIVGSNDSRAKGKKVKYELGSIHLYNNEYILTAFTHFSDNNKAYLTMGDFINFLTTFWNEVDRIYSGNSIVIPLLGSGIARLKGYEMISRQELLQILIWSYKISKVKLAYSANITFVIHESDIDKIDFYGIKESNGYGI